ncbi:MAG: hypothetical protein L0177_15525 [Chloroflexi bacterium]|nr:hypothetical protein [Chloroflexota bacterium]
MKRRSLAIVVMALAALFLSFGIVRATALSGSSVTGVGLDVAIGGVGLENIGSGTRTLNINIPGTVQSATLYWAGRDFDCPQDVAGDCILSGRDQELVFDGVSISGIVTGTEINLIGPPFDGTRKTQNIGYKSDVTSIVQAKGSGAQSFTIKDGNLASNLDVLDGAGLYVLYTDAGDSGSYQVITAEGLDFAFAPAEPGPAKIADPVTFAYDATSSARTAQLVVFAGDAESFRPDRIDISDNPSISNALNQDEGPSWDTDVFDITIPGGATSTSVTLVSPADQTNPDSLLWQLAALRLPVEAAAPAIDIEKATNGEDADSPTGPFIPVGGAVNWTYVVTNTGNVPLSNVAVTDDQGVVVTCPKDTLAVGESMTCTASGIAVAGQYANVGTTTGTDDSGTTVTDSDPSHYFGAAPAIDIEKDTNGHDADTPTGPFIPVGDPVFWTYEVTNTGNVPLNNVTVTDDQGVAVSCPKDTLAVGESMTCTASGVAVAGQYANLGTTTGTDDSGTTVTDSDPSHYFGSEPPPAGGEGCTPGYWKQKQHFDSWVGYSPTDKFDAVFGVTSSFGSNFTLLKALGQGGGGEKALGRHAVAALLNSSSSGVDFAFTTAQVIALVQEAYATGDFEGAKNKLEAENEQGCPLD